MMGFVILVDDSGDLFLEYSNLELFLEPFSVLLKGLSNEQKQYQSTQNNFIHGMNSPFIQTNIEQYRLNSNLSANNIYSMNTDHFR